MVYSFQFSRKELKKIPLLICMLGQNNEQEAVTRSHGTPFYEWYFCEKGRGEFVENGIRHVIKEGQAFFVTPNTPHSYKKISEEWIVHVIGFTGTGCQDIMEVAEMNKAGVYQLEDPYIFQKYVQRMIELKQENVERLQQELSKQGYCFLVDMMSNIQIIKAGVKKQDASVVAGIMTYMEENYTEPLSLDMLAEKAGLSKEYLCVIFKKETKYTIVQYLNIIRIGWARIFLEQYPEKSAYEIGNMCGFDSPSYFGKIFKRMVGVTPADYRKQSGTYIGYKKITKNRTIKR